MKPVFCLSDSDFAAPTDYPSWVLKAQGQQCPNYVNSPGKNRGVLLLFLPTLPVQHQASSFLGPV